MPVALAANILILSAFGCGGSGSMNGGMGGAPMGGTSGSGGGASGEGGGTGAGGRGGGTGGASSGGSGGAAGSSAGSSAGGSGGSASGSLAIVSFTTTATTLTGGSPSSTETGSATFTAIVTDSSGLDTIAGGQLLDDAGLTYAAFTAGASKSTFTAAVTWASVNQVSAVNFSTLSGQRTFVAKFFDNQGNIATANLTLALTCRGSTPAALSVLLGACAGTCTDTNGYSNCGACGNTCALPNICQNQTCTPIAASTTPLCLSVGNVDPTLTCTTFCASASLTCTSMTVGQMPGGGCSGSMILSGIACSTTIQHAINNEGARSFECLCQ